VRGVKQQQPTESDDERKPRNREQLYLPRRQRAHGPRRLPGARRAAVADEARLRAVEKHGPERGLGVLGAMTPCCREQQERAGHGHHQAQRLRARKCAPQCHRVRVLQHAEEEDLERVVEKLYERSNVESQGSVQEGCERGQARETGYKGRIKIERTRR